MKKYRRKFKQFVGRIRKLKIGTRAMNLAMFVIGWFLVIGLAIAITVKLRLAGHLCCITLCFSVFIIIVKIILKVKCPITFINF